MMGIDKRYDLISERISFGDLSLDISRIQDIDKLFDRLIEEEKALGSEKMHANPYWAELWPSSIALGQYLFKNPHLLKDKGVLEIGCGLGLSGMVAHALGARVTLSDYLPEALELAAYNWKKNFEEQPSLLQMDWNFPQKEHATNLLLAADVAYEKKDFSPLIQAFSVLLKPRGKLILCEPNRLLAKEFLHDLENIGFEYQKDQIKVEYRAISTIVNIYLLSSQGDDA